MFFHELISISILINIFVLISKCFCNNDVIGCGGFVKSIVNINYDQILIKLYTNKGIVKYTTDCAPNNGYYFIPLYDKGQYVLRIEPPIGWTFDPMNVELDFDGTNDLCSLQHDINFTFKGFTVSGKVLSEGSTSGPSGISITLRAKRNNNILKTTLTSIDGFYEFKEVLPGEYVIQASHHSWKFKINEIEISVISDNVNVSQNYENNISILGYEVIGTVLSDGQPINGVLFALYSKTNTKPVLGCDSKPIPITKRSDDNWNYLCHVSSDKNGLFRFQTVPIGTYNLMPFYRGKNIQFDVKPSELSFEVSNDNVKIETVFQVEGFSVSGRVVVEQKGVPNAEITLIEQNTGKEQIISTQTNGIYNLENVKTGNYEISVKASHMYFVPIVVKISPIASQIPDIMPNAFDVCGQLVFKTSPVNKMITINVKNNKFSESITADNSGKFCIALKPDSYVVIPMNLDKHQSLHFIPSQLSITVKSDPILDLRFTQFTASISGHINTIDSANDLQLKLINKRQPEVVTTLKYSQLRKISQNKLEFKFENVLPSLYSISVVKESNSWCWLSDTHDIEVIDKDLSDIEFVQKGYILSLYFSHIIDLNLKYPSNKVENLKIGSDHSLKHCVTESGIYSITPIGCHKFSDNGQEVITFDTTKESGKLISRTAVKHLLSANIITNLNVSDIVLTVKMKSFGSEEFTERLHLQQHRVIEGKNELLYEYPISIWAKPMVNVYLEPSSSHLLFKPNSYETKLEDDCLENLLTFKGRIGLFVKGQITPKLENVIIKILSSDQILLTTKSDSLGKYIAGPFDSDIELKVSAEKEGYVFKSVPNKLGYFESIRLSRVLVKVSDEKNEPLSDVLISISGGTENYRKNSVTPTNGQLAFNNLHSGQYFIRIMMKEYDFEPSSKMIDVSEGSNVNIEVRAKKVAFSCIGVTDSLNGEPEPGVIVEAIGIRNVVMNAKFNCSQLQEEAISEANGSFRIKGLRPECQYAIRIKSSDEKNKHISQSIPKIHLIRVEDHDVTNIRLIVFRKMTQMDVSGDVLTDYEHLPSLKVRLFNELNPDQPITAIELKSSPFFFLPPLPIDNRNYFIRLESSLSNNLYEFEAPSKSFRANTSHMHLTLNFNPKLRINMNSGNYNEQDISHGSIYTLPLLILLAILAYNYNKISPVLGQFLNFINRLNTERLANSENGNNSSLIAKRKTKIKKI